MAEQSPTLIRIVRVIDRFTDTTGGWVAWLSVPLVLAVSYEVIARYFFNAPTLWAFDVTYMLYGALFMLGAAYALHKGAHIRTDFLWEKWSVRTRGLIDAIAYVVFFFPSLIVLFFVSFHEAYYAWQIMETSEQTAWRPDAVAVQGGGAGDLSPAADPGRFRNGQEPVRSAHGHRARAQGEGGDMSRHNNIREVAP